MSAGEGDDLVLSETVGRFLHTILDIVVDVEDEKRRQHVRHIVEDVLDNVLRLVIGRESSTNEQAEESLQDKLNIVQDGGSTKNKYGGDTTQRDTQTEVEIPAKVYMPGSYVTRDPGIKCQQRLKPESQNLETGYITSLRTRCRSLMMEFAHYTPNDTNTNGDTGGHHSEATSSKKARGEYDAISGKSITSIWTNTSISDASDLANRLDSYTSKYGQSREESIKALQTQYAGSIHVETTDAHVKIKADELKDKVFPSFPKVKKVKSKHGKIKIYYNEDLSKEQQKCFVNEAKALLNEIKEQEKQIKEQEKQKRKERKEAESEGKGIGARIRKFFGRLFCCRSSADEGRF